jgi:hypothetical protein
MVEEAIRNGTWVPTTPPARNSRVDLTKKPELWEAYLGSGGWHLGGGKELDIDTNWKSESSREWESIKPISAGYIDSVSCSTPDPTSLSTPASIPIPTPINVSAPRRDEEENRRVAEVSSAPARSLFTRARTFLNSNSNVPASSSADNETNSRSISTNISMTELGSSSPSAIRVAVLVAMPSPSSSYGSSTPPSASISSKSQATTSHPLDLSSLPPTTLRDEEEQPLPHLVMGVADVVIGRSGNSSAWDNVRTRREDKNTHSRESSFAEP